MLSKLYIYLVIWNHLLNFLLRYSKMNCESAISSPLYSIQGTLPLELNPPFSVNWRRKSSLSSMLTNMSQTIQIRLTTYLQKLVLLVIQQWNQRQSQHNLYPDVQKGWPWFRPQPYLNHCFINTKGQNFRSLLTLHGGYTDLVLWVYTVEDLTDV